MAWNDRKFERDAQRGLDRIDRWQAVLGTDDRVREAYLNFVDVMRQEGEWIRAGHNPANSGWQNRAASVAARAELMEAFRAVDALRVPADWATRNRGADPADLAQARRDVAASSAENTAFWVKSTSRPAEQLGQSLEQGAGAGVFDQLTYGFDSARGQWSPSLWELWGDMAPEFARGTRGTPQVTVFEGLPESCVLRSVEWPALNDLIERGEVDHLHVNVIRRNSDTGLLEQVGHYDVRSQQEFDHLPAVTRTDSYVARQQREFVTQNVARAIERNRAGVQTTLDNFRRRWSNTGEDVEFVLSHPDGPGPDLTESPANLSRIQTNTSGQGQGQGSRQGSASGRRGSAASLMSRLEAIEAEQQQRGSDTDSIFPGRRGSSVAGTPGLSRVGSAVAGSSTGLGHGGGMPSSVGQYMTDAGPYAPSFGGQPPVSASGYFDSTMAPTTLPPISETYAPGMQALSDAFDSFSFPAGDGGDYSPGDESFAGGPQDQYFGDGTQDQYLDDGPGDDYVDDGAQGQDFAYPPPPVADTTSFNPPVRTRTSGSTPSTRSARSYGDEGADLTRVNAHTGDSPPRRTSDAQQPAGPQESAKKAGKKVNKKDHPHLNAFFFGGNRKPPGAGGAGATTGSVKKKR
ncbi:hypothetical protein [Streptomyces mangrovisoli]|uniref:Uncharacterized protein n=1 Tax=Streptomyces mangrovisoli TaxID=1428628 RepID=A0A1J4P5W7_9ACTN|nr:hypothetical protein [Streptomyces mangrovisoli]OIJ69156.1 hypothetical protein WN71_003995 [Streptomyces mangrovisoli]